MEEKRSGKLARFQLLVSGDIASQEEILRLIALEQASRLKDLQLLRKEWNALDEERRAALDEERRASLLIPTTR